jgi:DUF4097 and DUF4098 domain-containing protein YvlB
LGLLLLGTGVVLFLAPAGSGIAGWLMQLWPVFLICAGVVRVMGFAVERKPRSPLVGMLLIIVGVLFLVARFQPGLNALQIYGRYWVLLLLVFAAVELVRFYSHKHVEGPPPRVFTPLRVVVVLLIVASGVFANRVANKPSLLSALRLPVLLSGLRDSVVGEAYAFTDQPVVNNDLKSGMTVFVNNSYGSVKISGGSPSLKATLVKGVRGWSQDDAHKIADRIHLVMNQNGDGLTISTNRDEIAEQFTTDIQIELPSNVSIRVNDSYGTLNASKINGGLTGKLTNVQTDLNGIVGDVNLALSYSDVNATNIEGNLTVTGAKQARVSKVSGGVDISSIAASNGAVELHDISGPVKVTAPFCRIVAQNLDQSAEFKTEHASVDVSHAEDVVIQAPHADIIRAKDIGGDLRIASSNSTLQLSSITGELEVEGEQCSVNADEVKGGVSIETTHGAVVIKNFYEAVRVETSYRDVILSTSTEPTGDIEVQNNHGQIKLELPSSSRFHLDAQTPHGQIQPIGFNQLEKVNNSLVGELGFDGPTIKLRTSYKNIILQAGSSRAAQTARLGNFEDLSIENLFQIRTRRRPVVSGSIAVGPFRL